MGGKHPSPSNGPVEFDSVVPAELPPDVVRQVAEFSTGSAREKAGTLALVN